MSYNVRKDGSRFQVVFAQDRGDRCYVGKKGWYHHDLDGDLAIDDATVTGPFNSVMVAHDSGLKYSKPVDATAPKRVNVYMIDQTQLNRIREICQAGTQAHGDEFYEQIMDTLDGAVRMDG